jgi:hypothetical protein
LSTELTGEVALALALPLNKHSSEIIPLMKKNGFMCFRSRLVSDRAIWNCQRVAVRPKFLSDGRSIEQWILEFECDRALAHCTMVDYYAAIE